MAGTDRYQIQIGEHSIKPEIFGVQIPTGTAHLSIRFVEVDTGRQLVEINGLATERANPTVWHGVGLPWHPGLTGRGRGRQGGRAVRKRGEADEDRRHAWARGQRGRTMILPCASRLSSVITVCRGVTGGWINEIH